MPTCQMPSCNASGTTYINDRTGGILGPFLPSFVMTVGPAKNLLDRDGRQDVDIADPSAFGQ